MHGPLTFIFWRLAEADPIHPAGGKVPPARGLRARAFRDQLQDQGRKPFQWESEGRVKNRRRNAKPDLCLNIAPSRSHRECTVQIQARPDKPTPRKDPTNRPLETESSPSPETSPLLAPAHRPFVLPSDLAKPMVCAAGPRLNRGPISPLPGRSGRSRNRPIGGANFSRKFSAGKIFSADLEPMAEALTGTVG